MSTWTSKPWDSQHLPRLGGLPGREKSNLGLERALARAIRGLPPEPRTYAFDPWALSAYGPPTWGNHETRITRYVAMEAWRLNVRAAVRKALGLQ